MNPPSRVVFTWGSEGTEFNTQPGSTTVEVSLEPEEDGTRLTLVHSSLSETAHDGTTAAGSTSSRSWRAPPC